jgi:hypothetical protein
MSDEFNDLEAVRAVVEAIKGFDPKEQEPGFNYQVQQRAND